jgi:single-stranded-DNA-specific exonuclease
VASKLANRFHRPVAVLCDSAGMLKGSARSIPGIHLLNALSACATHLENYGGHALAAGLRLNRRQLTQFRQCFEQCVGDLTDPSTLIPQVIIDCELFFDQISDSLIDELTCLQPFGSGNPAPLFLAKNIEVVSWSPVGDNHRRMVLRQAGTPTRKLAAIWFNADNSQPAREIYHQIAFQLQWNHWNGNKYPQLLIVET